MVGGSASALLHVVENARERAAPGPRLPHDEQRYRARRPIARFDKRILTNQSESADIVSEPTARCVLFAPTDRPPMSLIVAYGLGTS